MPAAADGDLLGHIGKGREEQRGVVRESGGWLDESNISFFPAVGKGQPVQDEDGGELCAKSHNAGVVVVCAKFEAELAELDAPDRAEMLASIGLAEPSLASLAREAYRTLGQQRDFTAGE